GRQGRRAVQISWPLRISAQSTKMKRPELTSQLSALSRNGDRRRAKRDKTRQPLTLAGHRLSSGMSTHRPSRSDRRLALWSARRLLFRDRRAAGVFDGLPDADGDDDARTSR